MANPELVDRYFDQVSHQIWADDVTGYIHDGKLTQISSLPEEGLPQSVANQVRISPESVERFFTDKNMELLIECREKLEAAIEKEALFNTFCDAVIRYAEEQGILKNEFEGAFQQIDPNLVEKLKLERKDSTERLSHLYEYIDRFDEEAIDDHTGRAPNIAHKITAQQRMIWTKKVMEELHAGADAQEGYEKTMEASAIAYFDAADLYGTSVALHAINHVLRIQISANAEQTHDAIKGDTISDMLADLNKARLMSALGKHMVNDPDIRNNPDPKPYIPSLKI